MSEAQEHIFWAPADNRWGDAYYATGPLLEERLSEQGTTYYFKSLWRHAPSVSWCDMVQIKCFQCRTPCKADPPGFPYEFWFCSRQCDYVYVYNRMVEDG